MKTNAKALKPSPEVSSQKRLAPSNTITTKKPIQTSHADTKASALARSKGDRLLNLIWVCIAVVSLICVFASLLKPVFLPTIPEKIEHHLAVSLFAFTASLIALAVLNPSKTKETMNKLKRFIPFVFALPLIIPMFFLGWVLMNIPVKSHVKHDPTHKPKKTVRGSSSLENLDDELNSVRPVQAVKTQQEAPVLRLIDGKRSAHLSIGSQQHGRTLAEKPRI